jgi:hypothetical protein
MQLTGAAIWAIFEHSVVGLPRDVDRRIPAGFSLPCNTFLHSSGLGVTLDLRQPEGQRVRALALGGQPIDRQRRYSVVTSSFLARGYSGFGWFRDGITREHLGPVRQLIAQALRECRRLPNVDQRMVMIGGIRCGRYKIDILLSKAARRGKE